MSNEHEPAIVLTGQRERFARAIAEGMSQSDAYRLAFNAKRSTMKTINEEASRIMADRKVAARVEQLVRPAVESAELSAEAHLDELKRLRDIALTAGNQAAAIRAEELRGKVAGLYITKIETGEAGAFDSLAAMNKQRAMDAIKAVLEGRALEVTDVEPKQLK